MPDFTWIYLTCDTWHVTRDTWHVTRDTRHMTCLGGWTFSQNFSALALTVCDLWYYEDLEEKADWLTDLINDKAVYRTAPATPGLLNIHTHTCKIHILAVLWKSLKLLWLCVAEAAAFQRFHNNSNINFPLYLGNSSTDPCHCPLFQWKWWSSQILESGPAQKLGQWKWCVYYYPKLTISFYLWKDLYSRQSLRPTYFPFFLSKKPRNFFVTSAVFAPNNRGP